jgi:hypothetical protein
VLDPESRLIPVGAEALFTCKFRSIRSPYWEINGTKATNTFNEIYLRDQGFFIDQEQTNSDGSVILTMRVNGSYPRLHNSRIQCKTFTEGIYSEIATLLIIEGNTEKYIYLINMNTDRSSTLKCMHRRLYYQFY